MNINKTKTIKYLLIATFMLLLSGCTKPSYTMKISANTLEKNMIGQFPIKKDLSIGKISLTNPKVSLKNTKNKMVTGLNFAYKPPFFKEQKGKLYLSGKIKYDKNKRAFYLIQPEINSMEFNNKSLASMLPSNIKNILNTIVAEIFKQYPVYKIKSDDMKAKIIKRSLKKTDIKNGNLELTFGL